MATFLSSTNKLVAAPAHSVMIPSETQHCLTNRKMYFIINRIKNSMNKIMPSILCLASKLIKLYTMYWKGTKSIRHTCSLCVITDQVSKQAQPRFYFSHSKKCVSISRQTWRGSLFLHIRKEQTWQCPCQMCHKSINTDTTTAKQAQQVAMAPRQGTKRL